MVRREALLRAAVEVVAERGVSGATHRAIAARAGVPLSTTSYFFASIDELVLEALREFVARRVAELEAITAAVSEEGGSTAELTERFVSALTTAPTAPAVAQFESYLEVTRHPELRPEIESVLAAFERLAEAALAAAGARRPKEGARAFVALADGFALHRLAWPRGAGDAAALRDALRALFIAYAMEEMERKQWERRVRAGRG
jgi:DNA-binding transcriptional regulator YbjK